jgi:hypothetical protein
LAGEVVELNELIILFGFGIYLIIWIWFMVPKDLDYKPINLTHPYFYIMPFMFAPSIRDRAGFVGMFMPWIVVWILNIFNRIFKGKWIVAFERINLNDIKM